MDYLAEAKKFLQRAKDTNDVEETIMHVNTASEKLAKAIEELVKSHSMSGVSGLSWQEEDVLALLQDRGSRPGEPVPLQSVLLAWSTRSSQDGLFAALKGLELKGLLVAHAAETGYELTEAGYLRP